MPKRLSKNRSERRAVPPVPKIPTKILDRSKSGDPWIDRANDSIKEFNEFSVTFPSKYGWRFKTKESFEIEIQEAVAAGGPPISINMLYWMDTMKNLEAYTVMSVWRTAELLRNAVRSLSGGETVVSAIVARAAVEGVAQFLDISRKVAPTLEDMQKYDFQDRIVVNSELEELVLKSVFSSKLPDAEPELNPTNIITILQRISKICGQNNLMARYGVLCEVTHPNFLGRSVYVSEIETKHRIGDELRVLSPKHGPVSKDLIELSLWAISWSAATQVSSAFLMQSSIGSIAAKLKNTVH